MDLSQFLAPGLGAAIGVGVAMYLARRRHAQLAPRIEPALRDRGPMTLPELQQALDMNGFYARGKVVMALGQMVQEGRVEELKAPEGTPLLERVNHIRYRWKG